MTCQVENELGYIKHCWGVYFVHDSIENNVRVDEWTVESVTIASNARLFKATYFYKL